MYEVSSEAKQGLETVRTVMTRAGVRNQWLHYHINSMMRVATDHGFVARVPVSEVRGTRPRGSLLTS